MPAERTCVQCRERGEPADFVRLALAPDDGVTLDFAGKLPGRGAWVHPGCLAALDARPGSLRRAFKRQVSAAPLLPVYRAALSRAIEDGLSMASAAGALVGGHDVLTVALRAGEVVEVLLAQDIAAGTEKRLRRAAPTELLFTRIHLTAGELGARIGRGSRAAVGVRRSRAATHLLRQLRRLRGLG